MLKSAEELVCINWYANGNGIQYPNILHYDVAASFSSPLFICFFSMIWLFAWTVKFFWQTVEGHAKET